ncbi:hypothetical protein [Niabella aurantiaca]|nr:hypothetical protein [Niabella aurantiaca]
MQQPGAYLSNITACFGDPSSEDRKRLEKFLEDFLNAYVEWISARGGA